jgi:Fic family protein
MSPRGRPSRAVVYERLAAEVSELRQRLGGLPRPTEAAEIWNSIWHHEAHHSTALEGNTLVLREVEQLLAQGRAVGNKQLKEYLEVRGYAEAAKWTYDQGLGGDDPIDTEILTLTEVRHVHRLTMTPVWEVEPHPQAYPTEGPGNWRQHDIHPFPGGMRPPDRTEVPARMRDWVDAICRITADPSPIPEVLAQRHAEFEQIHPFLDGNGRTGRLLLNLVLVRLGYPPAIVQKRERRRYLAALQKADGGDPGPLGEMLARAILDNLVRFVVPAVAGPLRLVPLEALRTQQVSAKALGMAASRGRLRAVRGDDGRWRSTRRWVDEYIAQRWARRIRPKGVASVLGGSAPAEA